MALPLIMNPLNLIPSASAFPNKNLVISSVSSVRTPPKSRRMRSPAPPSASIHPQRVELVCSCKPVPNILQNPSENPTNSPPLKSPLEPILRAVLENDPNYDLSGLDFVASRANLRKLFRLVSVSVSRRKVPAELKFYVELIMPPDAQTGRYAVRDISGTVLLSSGDLQDDDDDDDDDVSDDDAGDDHGAKFLEHHSDILNSAESTGCSIEDTKIITYDLAGMRCMIKYPPIGELATAKAKQQNIQQDGDSEKRWRVRKRTKIRAMNHVDEWRRKVHDRVSDGSKLHHKEDRDAVHDPVPGTMACDDADLSKDMEGCIEQLEKLDHIVDLSKAMEHVRLHSDPSMESDVHYDTVGGNLQMKMVPLSESQSNRQRGDSVSSTSSIHSQASFRSMVSSRSSVSWAPGESSHQYHYHKKLQFLPTIAPTPPNEADSPTQYLGFDTPISNIWYRADLASSLFDEEAVEPLQLHEDEGFGKPLECEVVGRYRSTTKYRRVLRAWEKEHMENLKKLVDVLRKIRKAAGKAGRCKVVVDSSGRIRSYRVKQTKEEQEMEIGRVSILPPDLLAKWV